MLPYSSIKTYLGGLAVCRRHKCILGRIYRYYIRVEEPTSRDVVQLLGNTLSPRLTLDYLNLQINRPVTDYCIYKISNDSKFQAVSAMATYLVTGTSRGLGLELVKVLASQHPDQVGKIYAGTRSSTPNEALAQLIENSRGRVQHIELDVVSKASVTSAARRIMAELGSVGLDYLLNNAAIRDEWTPDLTDMSDLPAVLDTNVTGTHITTTAFLPMLRKGRRKTIVNFSSTLGCITTAQTKPGLMKVAFPAYKISKASTHMLTILWSNQLRDEGFCVYLQSPGNLKTQLAGGESADLPVEVGAKQVVEIAQAVRPEDTGRHRSIWVEGWEHGGGHGGKYDGKDLPW